MNTDKPNPLNNRLVPGAERSALVTVQTMNHLIAHAESALALGQLELVRELLISARSEATNRMSVAVKNDHLAEEIRERSQDLVRVHRQASEQAASAGSGAEGAAT